MSKNLRFDRRTTISSIDRMILAILQQDARRSFSDIASELGVSRTTIKDRMDRLQDIGVIKRFTIEISEPDDLNAQGVGAFFHIKLKRAVCKIVSESIKGWPELCGCWSIAGGTDMTLQVYCTSNDHLEELRARLCRHPEIKVAWTAPILRQWLQRSYPGGDYQPGGGNDQLDARLEEIKAQDLI